MKETFQIPTPETLEALTGKELYDLWTSLHQLIEQKYNMEQMWNHGGKKWTYEYKYRRGGKTTSTIRTILVLISATLVPSAVFSTI